MQVSDIYLALSQDEFQQLLRQISLGRLKTFQLFDRMKVRLHLAKLNAESLKKSAPKLMERMRENDADLATELAQAILLSHLDMIKDVLNALQIPHEEGFFAKDLDATEHLTPGWQQRVYDEYKDKYSPVVLRFYINHLDVELSKEPALFTPAAA